MTLLPLAAWSSRDTSTSQGKRDAVCTSLVAARACRPSALTIVKLASTDGLIAPPPGSACGGGGALVAPLSSSSIIGPSRLGSTESGTGLASTSP